MPKKLEMQKSIRIKCSGIAAYLVEIQILPTIDSVALNKVLYFTNPVSCFIRLR